jgi:hypothetical protein
MATNVLHVLPHNDGWAVKREGNERATSTHATQKEAIDASRTLAQEGDEIVIHRQDGTVRDKTTYTKSTGNGTKEQQPRTHDIVPVGSRVSWQAILAGLAVTITVYVCLILLAVAIGVSTVDYIQNRTFGIAAAVVGIVSLLAALFLGGYTVSRLTTRETLEESILYGMALWATFFVLVTLTGINLGSSYALTTQVGRSPVAALTERPGEALSADAQRRRDEMAARGEQLIAETSAPAMAWWALIGTLLSVAASVGGAVVGAGPEVLLRRFRRPEAPATTVRTEAAA